MQFTRDFQGSFDESGTIQSDGKLLYPVITSKEDYQIKVIDSIKFWVHEKENKQT